MKIAYVYDAVYPWEPGGVQKRVWEVGRRLADRHDVHWYSLKYWDGPDVIDREGVTLHGVMDPVRLYVDGRRSIPEAMSFSARLVRPLVRERFDVIDCQEFPYFPVFSSKLHSMLRGSRLVVTWHEVWGDYWEEYLGWKGVFGKGVERLTAATPDEHVAVSRRTRRDLSQLGVSDVRIVPNGIDADEIASGSPATRPVDLLYVGRLINEKNVDLLVEAVAERQAQGADPQCLIVGEGPERARLEAAVQSRGLDSNVTFIGALADYEDVLALMKRASVFVLPSRREGFGITALEALACGTPVVTIDHPQNAAQELVTDGVTGAVCTEDATALADGIRRARVSASADCVASARDYEWDRIAEETEQLYARAVGVDSPPRHNHRQRQRQR